MRILVTNDDGIHAPGLKVLEAIARLISDDVWIVAPETDQSGVSRCISLHNPLRRRIVEVQRFAVNGTPADCVIMGVQALLPGAPDLILSGVNCGQNVADDVTYSGTIAAAMEGSMLGIRSIALSQAYNFKAGTPVPWSTAQSMGAQVIERALEVPNEKGSLLNINFPNCSELEVKGVRITRQGVRDRQINALKNRTDHRGEPYYWLASERSHESRESGTDLAAMRDGFISITPLHLNLTDERPFAMLSEHFTQLE
ncbi:MAG: 5'/3'-nucleotidase SurE [Hyphomicrobiales bacterium]|nr:MAG: 5'/3'-nucleotidase SurE [Hyphomicrobiales bacterium]